eukprot:TRINITY_DN950_c0_g2_i1.p1 TRINITY_DN950_c0_g2~~TRINITY_DN950_c0_g2_i1.p1  ORF type:complete len:860 (+),score=236.63 TRINITY_DN950_c0_g2_i1:62-2641(+)
MAPGGGFPLSDPKPALGDAGRTPLAYSRFEAEARYANDSSAPAKQLITAEGHFNGGRTGEAIAAAEGAFKEFQTKGNASASADALRLLVAARQLKAYLSDDEEERKDSPEAVLLEELDKCKSLGDNRAEAVLQLSLCELLATGTAETGWWPGRTSRDRAIEAATRAIELFQAASETKMAALAKVENAFLLCKGSAPKAALQTATEAYELFERLEDKQGMGRALHAMAQSYTMSADFEEAVNKGLEALSMIRAGKDKRAEVLILEALAQWSLTQGKPQKALVVAKEALALRRDLGCAPLEEARSLLLVVETQAGVKRVRRGLKAAEEGLSELKKAGERASAYGYVVVAMAQLRRDHPELSLTAADEAVDIARELGDKRLEMCVHNVLTEINVNLQNKSDALESAEEAAIIAQELQDPKAEADAECALVTLLMRSKLDRHGLNKAVQSAKAASDLYRKASHKVGEGTALVHRASILGLDNSSSDEMLQAATEAYDIFDEEEHIAGQSAALTHVAEAQLQKEAFEEALQAAKDRRALWKGLGNKKEEGDAIVQQARIYLASKDWESAERHATEAQKLFQAIGEKAAESVACTHVAQAALRIMMGEADGETEEALGSQTYRVAAEKAMRAANDAITACRNLGSKQLRAGALFWRAQVLGFRGRLDEATRVVLDAESCFESIGAGSGMIQCRVLAADCQAGLKAWDSAKQLANGAIQLAGQINDREAEKSAKECLDRVDKAEKKSKELPAAPVQAAIAQAASPEAGQAAPVQVASAAPAVPEVKSLDPVLATKRLMNIVKDVVAADDEIAADSPLMEAGMDSLSSVQLVTEVSKEFQMTLSPSLVFDFPTVAAMVSHLVEESSA